MAASSVERTPHSNHTHTAPPAWCASAVTLWWSVWLHRVIGQMLLRQGMSMWSRPCGVPCNGRCAVSGGGQTDSQHGAWLQSYVVELSPDEPEVEFRARTAEAQLCQQHVQLQDIWPEGGGEGSQHGHFPLHSTCHTLAYRIAPTAARDLRAMLTVFTWTMFNHRHPHTHTHTQ